MSGFHAIEIFKKVEGGRLVSLGWAVFSPSGSLKHFGVAEGVAFKLAKSLNEEDIEEDQPSSPKP